MHKPVPLSPTRSVITSVLADTDKHFIDKINSELAARRVRGPFGSLPDYVKVSPFYVIPKSTPGKFRLIHNLSSPRGKSVNECIDPNMRSVSYCRCLDVAAFLSAKPESEVWYMAKVDMKDAYRCVPVYPGDWKYLGMRYKDKYFVDTCLPMGCASSCFLFQSISDAIAWMFERNNPDCKCFNYLDNFLILADSNDRCKHALDCFVAMLEFLGFPVSYEKTIPPGTEVEFLGLTINSCNLSFSVPDQERLKTMTQISHFVSKSLQRVHCIQKMVGKLTFLCATFLAGRCLLASLHEQLRGVLSSEGWYWRRVTKDIRADLRVWYQFLEQSQCKPFRFLYPTSEPAYVVETDASSYGFGAVMGARWFSGRWHSQWWTDKHITLLELYPIYVALHLWTEELSNNTILIRTDNSSLVSILTRFYSRNSLVRSRLL